MMVERDEKAQIGHVLSSTPAALVPPFPVPLHLHTIVISLIFKMCQKHGKFPKVFIWATFFPAIFRAFLGICIIGGSL